MTDIEKMCFSCPYPDCCNCIDGGKPKPQGPYWQRYYQKNRDEILRKKREKRKQAKEKAK